MRDRGVLASGPGESLQLVVPRPTAGPREAKRHAGCGFDRPRAGTACFFPAVSHAEPELSKILLSLGVVGAGYAIAIPFNIQFYGARTSGWSG